MGWLFYWICTAADKGQRTRMFLMKAKIQCKLETGMFKFLLSLRHARNGSSKNNSCHRNGNPLSQSSHWWQANASQRLYSNMYQGKIPSFFQNSLGLSFSSYGWLLGAFPAPSSPLSILCPSFTLCRINCRSCWNKRKKEPLNKDHHLPPPQRRWTFSEKKCSWRDVFESSILDRCSCLTMARKHQDTLPSKPHILITLGVRWVTKPWAKNLQHKIWILISCSHVNWRKIGETWVKHVYIYCKWLSLKIKTTTNSSQDLYKMKPPKFQQRLGEKQIKLCP